MGRGYEAAISFITLIPCALIIAVCFLMIFRKMIDGDINFVPGICALAFLLVILYACVHPPHPAFPILAVVAIISLMLTFPFAHTQLTKAQMQEIDIYKLERAHTALIERPDNFSAAFELAKQLYSLGFIKEAIAMGDQTVAILSTRIDPVRNISFKEIFRTELIMLDKWKRTPAPPQPDGTSRCENCHSENPYGTVVCKKCGKHFLLDKLRNVKPTKQFAAKLFLTWFMIGAVIIVAGGLGLVLGRMGIPVILVGILLAGVLLHRLFRVTTPGAAVKEVTTLYHRDG